MLLLVASNKHPQTKRVEQQEKVNHLVKKAGGVVARGGLVRRSIAAWRMGLLLPFCSSMLAASAWSAASSLTALRSLLQSLLSSDGDNIQ